MSNKNTAFQPIPQDQEELNNLIIDAIQDIKGNDIALFDLRHLEEASSDFFIVCHGNSNTQIVGIVRNIEKRIAQELGILPNHSEGKLGKNWLLVDYFSVVVHVFSREKREFYNIEDLWSDANVTKFDDLT